MTAKRVLHVIPHFGHLGGESVVGGHASALFTLARGQARAGYEVSIASVVPGARSGTRVIPGPIRLHSLSARFRPGSPAFVLEFVGRAVRACASLQRENDVIHVHSGYAEYALVSAFLKTLSRVPLVHSLYCRAALTPMQGLPGRKAVLSRAFRRLDHVITPSRAVLESVAELGVRTSALSLVRPPVDIERFESASPVPVRKALGIVQDELMILFVGNLSRTKNLMSLLSAFRQLRSECRRCKLVVTTEYPRSDERVVEQALEAATRDLGVSRLHFIEDMPNLIAAADVVVTPFLERSGPSDYFMVALEAMAAGKVVVSTAAGGMREILVSGENAIVIDPTDEAGLVRALRDAESDSALRRRLGASAQGTVRERFSVSDAVEATGRVYRSVER